jgi:hypothetical protein
MHNVPSRVRISQVFIEFDLCSLNVYELPQHFPSIGESTRHSGFTFADSSCNGRRCDNRDHLPICFGAFSKTAALSRLRFNID